jgi:hypothetical protein
MRENRLSGSEGGGAKPIVSPYPYSISHLWRSEQKRRECPIPLQNYLCCKGCSQCRTLMVLSSAFRRALLGKTRLKAVLQTR